MTLIGFFGNHPFVLGFSNNKRIKQMERLIDETTPLNRSVKYGKSDDDEKRLSVLTVSRENTDVTHTNGNEYKWL